MRKNLLKAAGSVAEVKEILSDHPELDAERIYEEIQNHRSDRSEKLDLDELDAVAGGSDRDWKKDGCAATCEDGSWCGSNDYCMIWDVTYDNFWVCCPMATITSMRTAFACDAAMKGLAVIYR